MVSPSTAKKKAQNSRVKSGSGRHRGCGRSRSRATGRCRRRWRRARPWATTGGTAGSPPPLGAEDGREEEEEGEQRVEGLAADVEEGLEVHGNDRRSDVGDGPETHQGAGPRRPGEPPGPEPSRLTVAVVHPRAGHRQAHPEGEQVEIGGQPDGGEAVVGRVVVLELEHIEAPSVADHHQHHESQQLEPEGLRLGPAGSPAPEHGGVEGDEQVERHLDAQRPGRGDALRGPGTGGRSGGRGSARRRPSSRRDRSPGRRGAPRW